MLLLLGRFDLIRFDLYIMLNAEDPFDGAALDVDALAQRQGVVAIGSRSIPDVLHLERRQLALIVQG
jgi:hypothetical protein